MVHRLVAQHTVRRANMLGHLQHRQQVFQLALGIARGIVAEHGQGIVVVGDGRAEVLGQAPGFGCEVANH
ncbi:hypothetical protein D9M71_501410 [compost metagenome]